MSKKKSLGSSPIGFKSKGNSLEFIPDLGVSKSKSTTTKSKKVSESHLSTASEKRDSQSQTNSKPEKKVVSYNLEIDLIEKVKSLANRKDLYYSTLVSLALKSWIAEHR